MHDPLPMDDATWNNVRRHLALSAQQLRITELILRDCQDKQIAAELDIAFSTLRSHIERIFRRLDVDDRQQLILRIFRLAQEMKACPQCGPSVGADADGSNAS